MTSPRKKVAKRKKSKPIERLMEAMDDCARARGETMYTLGWRSAKGEPVSSSLFEKQRAHWRDVTKVESSFRRLAMRLLREAAR
jgi:hypothetical protein